MNVSPLALRVLDAVHAASYEMVALLSLVGIEESDEVPTAEVSCTRRPLLRINPRFVAAHCATDEHLFVLVIEGAFTLTLMKSSKVLDKLLPLFGVYSPNSSQMKLNW